jgi:hypothetical protein
LFRTVTAAPCCPCRRCAASDWGSVDGADLQRDGLADAQTARIHNGKARFVDRVADAAEQLADLIVRQCVRQPLLSGRSDPFSPEQKQLVEIADRPISDGDSDSIRWIVIIIDAANISSALYNERSCRTLLSLGFRTIIADTVPLLHKRTWNRSDGHQLPRGTCLASCCKRDLPPKAQGGSETLR